ncbi:flippase [candidate division WOR-3 bacterium]|nr:flippase [candidate division WOR-3 bacterium]
MTKNPTQKFAFDVGWIFISSIVVVISGLVLNVIVGNVFGPEGLGLFSLMLSIYVISSVILTIGIPSAVTKFTAEYRDKDSKINSIFTTAFISSIILGLIATLLLFFVSPLLSRLFDMSELTPLIRMVSFALIFFVPNKVLFSLLNGLRKMRLYALCEIGRYLMLIVFALVISLKFTNLEVFVISFIITEFLLFPLLLYLALRSFHFDFSKKGENVKRLLRFGSQVLFGGTIGQLNSRIDLLLIGFFMVDKDVGIYAIAAMFARGLLIIPQAVQKVAYPTISSHFAKNQIFMVKNLINTLLKYHLILISLFGFIIVFFFDNIVKILYPGEAQFLLSFNSFYILLFGIIFFGSTGILGVSYKSAGKPYLGLVRQLFMLVSNIILNIILIPIYGILGAAIATTISFIIHSIVGFILTAKVLKLDLDNKSYYIALICSIIVLSLAIFGRILRSYNMYYFVFIILFYVGILFVTKTFNWRDREILRQVISIRIST